MNVYKNRIIRVFWYSAAMMIRPFAKVKRNRMFCQSYSCTKYACNPRAITEYILRNAPDEYEIYWAFKEGDIPSGIDKRIHIVKKYSFRYLLALYTSKFVITNVRNYKYDTMFVKKRSQKYIMTWHGTFPLKLIGKDSAKSSKSKGVKIVKEDSRMCDLMLSNCKRFTGLIQNSFWYEGEILEKCIPRNDLYYNPDYINRTYSMVREKFGFGHDTKIVLYAPTFRNYSNSLNFYSINWENIVPSFEKLLGNHVEVLLRLHPNMSKIAGIDALVNSPHVHNITSEPDVLEFIFASDAMVSDYSSTMFDFARMKKPCFIYAVDRNDYDRGFYFSLDQLPFPVAENEAQLQKCIADFSYDGYIDKVKDCFENLFGLDEDGNSSKRLYEWMKRNR